MLSVTFLVIFHARKTARVTNIEYYFWRMFPARQAPQARHVGGCFGWFPSLSQGGPLDPEIPYQEPGVRSLRNQPTHATVTWMSAMLAIFLMVTFRGLMDKATPSTPDLSTLTGSNYEINARRRNEGCPPPSGPIPSPGDAFY